MKNELQNIISGKSQVRHRNFIQTISRYLRKSESTGRTLKSGKQIKGEETALIKQFCTKNGFWITEININAFISSGAEQKVCLQNKFLHHKTIFYTLIRIREKLYSLDL